MTQSAIADLIRQRTGLNPESTGSVALARAIRLRMAHYGLRRMQEYSECVSASDDELQELIEAIVVPETWFFRDREAFQALVRLAMDEWLPMHPFCTLRVLSLPCATGEEPFSITMALLDGGFPPARFEVEAVDISRRVLAQARRAEYGKNSFRGTDLDFRTRHFQHAPDGYRLLESVREHVRFRYGNLLEMEPETKPYDIIFCRNLLIYFDAPTQRIAIENLNHLLDSKGLLFVGPAEAFLIKRSEFTPLKQARSFAFWKEREVIGTLTQPVTFLQKEFQDKPQKSSSQKSTPLPTARHKTVAITRVPSQMTAPSTPPLVSLEDAGRLADDGRLLEAAAMCETYLQQTGISVAGYLLLGLTRDALGDVQRAIECYRKVLYLQPDHAEALAHLALLSEGRGDMAGARRLKERLRRAASCIES